MDEHELAILDENHEKKPNRISIREQKSPNRQMQQANNNSQNYVITTESVKMPDQLGYPYEPQENPSISRVSGLINRRGSNQAIDHEKSPNSTAEMVLPPTTGPKSVKKVS